MKEKKEKKPWSRKKKVFIGIIVLILLFAFLGGGSSDEPAEPKQTDPISSETVSEESANETSEPVTETEPEPQSTKYKASTYKVGVDIPAGEYVVFQDGFMGYWEIAKDSEGTLDSILANENIAYNSIVTLQDGLYFKMTGCYAVPLVENPSVDTSGSGMFKVGTHINAGEYKVEVDENSSLGYGYVEVSANSSNTLDAIISNDNFEGSKYITVSDGQYLKLYGCHIVQ